MADKPIDLAAAREQTLEAIRRLPGVTAATVASAPYAGTALGSCLATAFRGAIVPAYAGSPVTVSKTVVIR